MIDDTKTLVGVAGGGSHGEGDGGGGGGGGGYGGDGGDGDGDGDVASGVKALDDAVNIWPTLLTLYDSQGH